MATTDGHIIENPVPIPGGSATALIAPAAEERLQARELARRYRCEFLDLEDFRLDASLLRKVEVGLMFRYNFVPLEEKDGVLVIALADPSQLMMIDEIGLLLRKRLEVKVAALSQISDILKKSEQSQRVLDEASEAFTLNVIRDEEGGDEQISVDRLTGENDLSPMIKLVDTTIFTALERRASDIHIETGDDSVQVKYRIDGVLQPAVAPDRQGTSFDRLFPVSRSCRSWTSPSGACPRTAVSGSSTRAGPSISACRSCLASTAKTPCCACSTRSRMSEKFHKLILDVVGFNESELQRFRRYIARTLWHGAGHRPHRSGKTTTLYAALNEIKTDEDKIITIEDPVEYQIERRDANPGE